MIPKKIHYAWFGGKEKPKKIRDCMATWEKHLADYEIIEWNESNFDVYSHPYVKEAYQNKKWAYVSDYVRAKVLFDQGGIYLDTDVLVLDNLDEFRKNRAFVGFENPDYPFTAVWGCEKHHPLAKSILEMYDQVEFQYDINDEMKFVNTKTVSDILINQYSCLVNNKYQVLKEDIIVYPDNILCNPSAESSTIHVFTGTWIEARKTFKVRLSQYLRTKLTSKGRAKLYAKYFGND
ncbi:glycosyltransferase family 32 protein [Enterococcus lemanii]|uniref:Glycosyltransferase family 32 protein n=1 Tax=Enterococcus lemanii TaxID=1159752 RepID=A0ABV9MV09_9ENTE|nr:glycosyltransferase [Enterococcus lemanii]MBM7709079.1 hypothetical protein [Enterococcus lemanii]